MKLKNTTKSLLLKYMFFLLIPLFIAYYGKYNGSQEFTSGLVLGFLLCWFIGLFFFFGGKDEKTN